MVSLADERIPADSADRLVKSLQLPPQSLPSFYLEGGSLPAQAARQEATIKANAKDLFPISELSEDYSGCRIRPRRISSASAF